MKRAVLILLVTLAVLIGGSPAYAAPPVQQATPLTLDVRAGFDGYVQASTWTPITVTASNSGEDVSGELRVQTDALTGGKTLYTYPIELPRGSRKQVTLYPADLSTFGNTLQVDLVSGSQPLASQQVRVQFVDQTALLIGVWSDSPGAFASLGDVKPTSGKVSVAFLTEEDLPPVADGWEALDVLVIADADSGKLSQDQQAALYEWIAQGGRLILVGGAGWQRMQAGLADLTPLAATGTSTASLEPLAAAVGQPLGQQGSADALVAVGNLAEGAQVFLASGSVPLVAWRQVGYGRVDFLAADPGLEPLRSWRWMGLLWTLILADGEARPGWAYGFSTSQWEAARQAVAAVPGVQLPSVLQLCGFLALYAVLIGPVNYLILWRLKKREWAWFTIPTLVILFSAIAYLTGFQLRGSQVILHRLAVIQSWQGSDTAELKLLLGVWSPRRARYDIEIEPGYLARPLPRDLSGALTSVADTVIEDEQAVTLRRVQVDIGSVQPFVIEGFTQESPRIEGSLTMSPSGGGIRVVGDILNSSDVSLQHVRLLLAGSAQPLADLPAGGVLHVDTVFSSGNAIQSAGSGLDPFPANTNYYYPYAYYYSGGTPLVTELAGADNCYDQTDAQRRCNLAASILTSDARGAGIYLVGWSDRVPLRTGVLNASSETHDLALYIIQMTTRLADSAQALRSLPPGLMTWQVLESSGSGYYGTSPYDLYLSAGYPISFRFEPVALMPVPQVDALLIHLDSYDTTMPVPRVEIWNFDTGRWDRLQVGWGDTRINHAARYADVSGGVDLRISTDANYGISISRFDVTLLGE